MGNPWVKGSTILWSAWHRGICGQPLGHLRAGEHQCPGESQGSRDQPLSPTAHALLPLLVRCARAKQGKEETVPPKHCCCQHAPSRRSPVTESEAVMILICNFRPGKVGGETHARPDARLRCPEPGLVTLAQAFHPWVGSVAPWPLSGRQSSLSSAGPRHCPH